MRHGVRQTTDGKIACISVSTASQRYPRMPLEGKPYSNGGRFRNAKTRGASPGGASLNH